MKLTYALINCNPKLQTPKLSNLKPPNFKLQTSNFNSQTSNPMLPFPAVIPAFSNYLACSHMIIDENGVTFAGLFTNLVSTQMEDANIECDFELLNLLLTTAYDLDETLPEQIAEGISSHQLYTLDLTPSGGLLTQDILYCMEPVDLFNHQPFPSIPYYTLRGILAAENSCGLPLPQTVPAPGIDYYLRLLAIQYEFYQMFLSTLHDEEIAVYYAGLQQPVLLKMAALSKVQFGNSTI
jgi:hypothetical protein